MGLVGGDAFVVSGSRDATVLVWRWNERLQRVSASDRAEGEYQFYEVKTFVIISFLVIVFLVGICSSNEICWL